MAPPAGGEAALEAAGLRDRAHVLLGGRVQGVLVRGGAGVVNVSLPREAPPGRVELLVESLGRVNYGRGQMGPPDSKGIAGVRLAGAALEGAWRMTPLPLESEPLGGAPAARWQRGPAPRGAANVGPWLYRGVLRVAQRRPADTWLCTPGASRKGFVWVNGFNLGVFWSRGPQRALFLPAPLVPPRPRTKLRPRPLWQNRHAAKNIFEFRQTVFF